MKDEKESIGKGIWRVPVLIVVGYDLPPFVTPLPTKLTPVLSGPVLMVMNTLHRGHVPDCAE